MRKLHDRALGYQSTDKTKISMGEMASWLSERTSKLVPAIVFLASAALYIWTTAPTLGGAFDSEEFQHVAYTLGIAHATGYPLYLILGKLFITLFPLGDVAHRMNLLSALIGAGAVTLVYAITFHLTRRQIASIATAALFATNAAVWRQSGVASVGPLTLFFMAAVTFAALLWEEHKFSVALIAFVFGLALTHHHSILLFSPGLVAFVLIEDPGILSRPKELARIAFWFLIPLLIYLYVPLRGSVSEWYNNSLESFVSEVGGTDAGDFLRTTPTELLSAAATLFSYFYSSFTFIGALALLAGAVSVFPRISRWQAPIGDHKAALMFGFGTVVFVGIGLLYGGEPDRYLSLPFFFIVFWFGIGAAFLQNLAAAKFRSRGQTSAQIAIAILVSLPIIFTVGANYRYADWSSFDRVYKQWDEIFTLPVPQNASIVGNWGQLNAIRYFQFVDNRRRDIRPIGTLYDVAPQTNAAREAFEQNRAIFLAPGIPQPPGAYRFAQLGPLLELRIAPQPEPLVAQKNIAISPSLTLADFAITTALEPYAPTQIITPTRTARIWLDWRAEGAAQDFHAVIRLSDPQGRVIAQIDEPPVRGFYPPSQWSSGEYIRDIHNLLIPGGTPPGLYRITLSALEKQVELGSVAVDRITTLARDQVFVARSVDIGLDDRIAILGYGGLEGTRRPGDTVTAYIVWYAKQDIKQAATPTVTFAFQSKGIDKTWNYPALDYYPPSQWTRGEIIKAYYDVEIPRDAPEGTLGVSIGPTPDGRYLPLDGAIQITPK